MSKASVVRDKKPRAGMTISDAVNSIRASVNRVKPRLSGVRGSLFSVAGRDTRPISRTPAESSANRAYTPRQPTASIMKPISSGPNARPMPNTVPRMLNALVRWAPSYSWASAALPLAKIIAAARPCSALNTPDRKRLCVRQNSRLLRQNSAAPAIKIRFLSMASAATPAASKKLPKVSIKPLVSHDSAAGEPPSDCCIAGVVMTPPVKLNGSSKAAIKTESAPRALAYREGVLAGSNIGRPSSVGKKE